MMICPHCGKETSGIAFCECCGKQIPKEARPDHKKKNSKIEYILAVGVGLCTGAVIILGAFMISRTPGLLNKGGNKPAQGQEEQNPDTAAADSGLVVSVEDASGAGPSDADASGSAGTEKDSPEVHEVSAEEMNARYEAIYEEFSGKLTELTPKLLEEYDKEAEANEGGIEGLTDIFDSKIDSLSEVYIKGTEAMTNYMYEVKSSDSDMYLEWTQKLSAVFLEESQKITDEYTKTPYGK